MKSIIANSVKKYAEGYCIDIIGFLEKAIKIYLTTHFRL